MSVSTPTIAGQLKALQGMSAAHLRTQYRELFGEETTSHNREFLFKRIAWRLQEQAFGGLSQRTKDRLATLVDDTQIRVRPPQAFRPVVDAGPTPEATPVEPPTGKILSRIYKGQSIEVTILAACRPPPGGSLSEIIQR